jgi:plastocyanin
MKWISLIIGGIIIIGGIWFLMSPDSADGPAVQEGTAEEGTESAQMPAPGFEGSGIAEKIVVTTEEPTGDPIFQALVEYTDEGFTPNTVTIGKGDTVRFVNNSSQPLWVASNIHPIHSVYPEKSDQDCLGSSFDTCRVLQAAEFWEFTFDQVGEWGYHNHVRAQDEGVIAVVAQ